MPDLPSELLMALESGVISRDQLVELITLEARALNLTMDQAIEAAAQGSLPMSALGMDLAALLEILQETPAAA